MSESETSALTPYEMLGGETKLRALVERFYELMDTVPEYYGVRKLHPADLQGSTQKLFMFLSGWLGGPPLFVEQYGHPRLRARHLPFEIRTAERDQWMACMDQAMVDVDVPEGMRERLRQSLFQTADWMRNREG
ncbi:MAG TPA: group II truncated hemoglobin [Burkholderiales bacterium]|nr:group II truncated hemoglobin [Burkholderiales bacterium]